jgi:hypothetical protein
VGVDKSFLVILACNFLFSKRDLFLRGRMIETRTTTTIHDIITTYAMLQQSACTNYVTGHHRRVPMPSSGSSHTSPQQ